MEEVIQAAYQKYEEKLQTQLAEVKKTKEMLNRFAQDLGNPMPFPDIEDEIITGIAYIKPDQFFRRPLATCVTEILTMKDSAMPYSDIVATLKKGGYEMKKSEESQIRLSLAKNTATFVLIGENTFGLKEKYGESKKEKPSKSKIDSEKDDKDHPKNDSNEANEENKKVA